MATQQSNVAATILLVDDTPGTIDVVQAALARDGYSVVVATNGSKAIQRAALLAPDLILLDVIMPGMDGYETCRQLKAQEATRDIPVIFLSSLNETFDKVKGFELGAVDYLIKPIASEELLVRVRTHVTINRLERELRAANRSLEQRVTARTAELSDANIRLVEEIKERTRAQEEVCKLNQELEVRVAQRTAALERANRELETFSYSVSHDLRAPLRAISGFSRILHEGYQAKLDTEGQRLLDMVHQGAVQMGQLIDDILAFSRMARTKMGTQLLDMTALAREVFAELHADMPNRKIRFTLDTLPPATGDLAMLRQVWCNLLGNAIKYTAPREEAVIEVCGSVQDNELVYSVKDNGAGFDMQYAGKLFGVFQRLHTESQFEGTGIGLAIVQRIIARHGGRVWAEGKVNEGATFHFALPNLCR